jgi:O-antigen/teichoic acid export membrane protein
VAAVAERRRTFIGWVSAVVSVLGARSFAAAAAFIGNVIVARHLGEAGFGHFYVLFSLMTIVAGVTGPAIDTSLVRCAVKHIGSDRDDSTPYFTAVFYVKVLLSILTVLVGWFYGDRIMQLLVQQGKSPYAIGQKSITLAFIGGAVVSLWGLSQSYFQAHQRFTMFSGYEFCSSLLRLGLVICLVALNVVYVPLYMIMYVAAPLTMMMVSWTHLPWRVFVTRPESHVLRELAVFGAWVFVATVFTTMTQRLDILMLKTANVAPETLGRYSAAVAIVLAGELVLLTFYSVLLPKAAAMKTAGELRQFIGQFRLPSLVFCLALTLAIPFSGLFCRIALGPNYEGTADYFSVLLVGVIVSLACAPTVTALYSLGYAWLSAIFEGTRLVLTFGLGLWAIDRHGAFGMACVMGGVRAATSLASYVIAHQTVKYRMIRDYAREQASGSPA